MQIASRRYHWNSGSRWRRTTSSRPILTFLTRLSIASVGTTWLSFKTVWWTKKKLRALESLHRFPLSVYCIAFMVGFVRSLMFVYTYYGRIRRVRYQLDLLEFGSKFAWSLIAPSSILSFSADGWLGICISLLPLDLSTKIPRHDYMCAYYRVSLRVGVFGVLGCLTGHSMTLRNPARKIHFSPIQR